MPFKKLLNHSHTRRIIRDNSYLWPIFGAKIGVVDKCEWVAMFWSHFIHCSSLVLLPFFQWDYLCYNVNCDHGKIKTKYLTYMPAFYSLETYNEGNILNHFQATFCSMQPLVFLKIFNFSLDRQSIIIFVYCKFRLYPMQIKLLQKKILKIL